MSKKDDIIQAATELFARQGYNGTPASEIAQCAGVAQGTVFHHFKSKENLLVSICDELVQSYVKGIREASLGKGSGWECLEKVLEFSIRFLDERSDAISVAFRETRAVKKDARKVHDYFQGLMMQVIDVIQKCIERGQSDGSIRQAPPYETAHLIHILIKGIHHSQMHGLLELPDLKSEALEFCCRSLCSKMDQR